MAHANCCVLKCKNTGYNSKFHFYRFPKVAHKILQRQKWIDAMKKHKACEASWMPKPESRICSEHFLGGEKSDTILSPSFVPSIFPGDAAASNRRNEAMLKRHARFMKRRIGSETSQLSVPQPLLFLPAPPSHSVLQAPSNQDPIDGPINQNIDESLALAEQLPTKYDRQCQVFLPITRKHGDEFSNNFTCERHFYHDKSDCDAGVQTDLIEIQVPFKIPSKKQMNDKSTNTIPKKLVDQGSGPSFAINDTGEKKFAGFSSIKTHQQLLDIAGVSFSAFQFLLSRMPPSNYSKTSVQNCLLIFLVKIKTGMTFCAMSVFFSLHETSISRIFHKVLSHLASVTKNLVFWPDKDTVQITMPECFKPNYENTRVIIDCTEFKIQVPAGVDTRVYTYSHYKKGFTAKLLVGITPSGFISFKSKVAGGRKSDSQLTIESGLVDLLEDGDAVLADKGFPQIKSEMDKSGKATILVMPPFLEKKNEFTKEEADRTYEIAKVRIHVERIMQRLRTHKILDKIPEHLFNTIDDIVHICCVLVNLQPPIISENGEALTNE